MRIPPQNSFQQLYKDKVLNFNPFQEMNKAITFFAILRLKYLVGGSTQTIFSHIILNYLNMYIKLFSVYKYIIIYIVFAKSPMNN